MLSTSQRFSTMDSTDSWLICAFPTLFYFCLLLNEVKTGSKSIRDLCLHLGQQSESFFYLNL